MCYRGAAWGVVLGPGLKHFTPRPQVLRTVFSLKARATVRARFPRGLRMARLSASTVDCAVDGREALVCWPNGRGSRHLTILP